MSVRSLSKELQAKAINDLNEDATRIQHDLTVIRDWAKTQPHLKIRTDDQWLLNFLRGCKFDLDVAKTRLDLLCTLKTAIPEFFSNRDPFLPEIQELLKLGVCLPLPKTADPAAPRVVLTRVGPINPAKILLEDGIKLLLMILDILLNEDDNCVVAGNYLFIDTSELSMHHIVQGPIVVPKFYKCLTDAYPLKCHGFHIVNAPSFAETMYDAYKSLADQEIIKLVYFYNDNNKEELYNSIPLSILPSEYGGDAGSFDDLTDFWKQKVESYKDWFVEDAQYCSDETKRSGEATSADLFNTGPYTKLSKMEFD